MPCNLPVFIRTARWTYTKFKKLLTKSYQSLLVAHLPTSKDLKKAMSFHQIQVSRSSQVDVDCPIRRWYVWNPSDHEANLPTPQVVKGTEGVLDERVMFPMFHVPWLWKGGKGGCRHWSDLTSVWYLGHWLSMLLEPSTHTQHHCSQQGSADTFLS